MIKSNVVSQTQNEGAKTNEHKQMRRFVLEQGLKGDDKKILVTSFNHSFGPRFGST